MINKTSITKLEAAPDRLVARWAANRKYTNYSSLTHQKYCEQSKEQPVSKDLEATHCGSECNGTKAWLVSKPCAGVQSRDSPTVIAGRDRLEGPET
jgi:hypothetical protein